MSNTKDEWFHWVSSQPVMGSAQTACGEGCLNSAGQSSEQSQLPLDPIPTEEQLDFDRLWADSLREKYGINKPIQ